jgi:hypothetical protein
LGGAGFLETVHRLIVRWMQEMICKVA